MPLGHVGGGLRWDKYNNKAALSLVNRSPVDADNHPADSPFLLFFPRQTSNSHSPIAGHPYRRQLQPRQVLSQGTPSSAPHVT